MSGWAAPYFSWGSTGFIEDEVSSQNRADSPQGNVGALEFISGAHPIRFSLHIRKSLGDCAHARDAVLARASMTYVVRALFVYG